MKSPHTLLVNLGRVLIVEDESFTLTMLATTVQALGFGVTASCTNAASAMRAQAQEPAEVALLDLDLGPGPSGIDVAYALRELTPQVGLILLTSFSDPRVSDPAERALPRGMRHLVKSTINDAEVLRTALVAARQHPLERAASVRVSGSLTSHQLAVLKLVAQGASNAEIATAHGVTEKAVERTIQRISDALEVPADTGNRRVQLTRAYAALAGKEMP